MNFKFKSLVAAAAFIATHAALAAPVTLAAGTTAYKGVTLSGQDNWSLQRDLLSVVYAFGATPMPVAPATFLATPVSSTSPRLLNATLTAPVSAVVVESTTDDIVSVTALGGLTLSAPADDMLTSGGAVTLTNLQIDLVNKKVYADLRGENGVAAANHLAVWTFGIAPAAKAPVLAGTSSSLTVSGLSITPEALAAVTQAIAATPDFGEIALKSLQNYGAITVSLTATKQVEPCSVAFKTTPAGTRPAYLANQVTVTNSTSSPATGWAVQWQYPNAVIVTSAKNATLSQTAARNFTAKPVKANTTLAAGASTTFSFSTYYAGTAPAAKVLSATVAGQACAMTQP
jgi:hypothetical protein